MQKTMKHNAYLLEASDLDSARKLLLKEALLPELAGELYNMSFDQLSIDDARDLASTLSMRAQDSQAYHIIFFNSMGVEAQNALLKVFEELPPRNVVFLITPNIKILLPTLRSRFFEVTAKSADNEISKEALMFLSSDAAERLELIAKIMKKDDTKLSVMQFIDDLERATESESGKHNKLLKKIILIRKAYHLSAQPIKALIESLAFD